MNSRKKKLIERTISNIVYRILNENSPSASTYYVEWSSWFDTHPYNISKIVKAVKSAGGTDIRKSKQYGWSNQPEVVTFKIDSNAIENVKEKLQSIAGVKWPIISEKDW